MRTSRRLLALALFAVVSWCGEPAYAQTRIPAGNVWSTAEAKSLETLITGGQMPASCTIAAGASRVFTEGGSCGQAVNGALVLLTDATGKQDCGASGNPAGSSGGGTIPNLCQYRSSTGDLEPFGGGGGDVTGGSTSTAGELAAYSSTTGKAIGRTSGQPIGGGASPGMAHAIFYDSAAGRWVSRSLIDAATYLGGSFAHSQIADLFAAMLGGRMAACRTGFIKGFGYDGNKFDETCGNYNWSAESGGATYTSATTSGGNSEYLTCSAAGVGASDGGVTYNVSTSLFAATADAASTTTVLEETAPGWTTNQWRDRVVRCTEANAADCAGGARWTRRIASNDTDTLTLTVDRAFPAEPDGDAYGIFDDLGSVCWAAGERVKTNFMADAMLAQDHTRSGGTVYFPSFAGYDHGIYVDRGCGRKGAAGTAVSNSCPVLAPPYNTHRQRTIEQFRRVRWIGSGQDPNLFDPLGDGRSGTWFIDDRGTIASGSANIGYDPNDGITQIQPHAFKSGVAGNGFSQCVPVSSTNRNCAPASNTAVEVSDGAWGRIFNFVNSTPMEGDATSLCISDTLSESGTCRGDRRIGCDAAGVRTSATTGGCDFGGGPDGGDIGPCESAADALQYEITTNKREPQIQINSVLYEFPDVATPQVTGNSTIATVKSANGAACGSGIKMETYAWPFTPARISQTDSRSFVVLDYERWYNVGGGYQSIVFSVNNTYGRDLDGDAVSDVGDCLSGGAKDLTNDEPGCEWGSLLGLQAGYGGGFEEVTVAYGSGNVVDGSQAGFFVRLYNSLIAESTRGSWGDASNWDLWNNTFLRNRSENGFAVNFSHGGRMREQKFIDNEATTLIDTQHGKGFFIDGLYFSGNNASVLLYVHHASDLRIANITAENNNGQLLMMASEKAFANVTVENVTAYAVGHHGTSTYQGKAAISYNRLATTTYGQWDLRNISFRDIHFETDADDTCLFYFDFSSTTQNSTCTGSGTPNACCTGSGTGTCEHVNTNRTQFSITDASIDALNGATGLKALCVDDLSVGGAHTAAQDDGIETVRHQPTWRNVRVNGVPIPDQPYPMVAAASAGDANTLKQGTTVKIYDDATAGGCLSTSGVLSGGGTAVSTCVVTAGAWSAGEVSSSGSWAAGAVPMTANTTGDAYVTSGMVATDGTLQLDPATTQPSELRLLEDADDGGNFVSLRGVPATSGGNLTGNPTFPILRAAKTGTAAGGWGAVHGGVSNGGSVIDGDSLCDLAYFESFTTGDTVACLAGSTRKFGTTVPADNTVDLIACGDDVDSGVYFETACTVE